MISSLRNIANGDKFDRFFPESIGKDTIILKYADVDDTLDLIEKVVYETLEDTKQIAQILKKDHVEDTCEAIWNFVYKHIQYKLDEDGVEQVRRPSRTWKDRKTGVDCDCYSVFISSILTNLQIPHVLRITDNTDDGNWNHIYPVVLHNNKEIVIDCVMHIFNKEDLYFKKIDKTMQLARLDGLPTHDDCGCGCNGAGLCQETQQVEDFVNQTLNTPQLGNIFDKIGKGIKNATNWVGDKAKDAWQGVKTVFPLTVAVRNGILLYLKLNLGKSAERLRWGYLTQQEAAKYGIDAVKWRKVAEALRSLSDKFKSGGGNRTALANAIFNGKGNKNPKLTNPKRLSPPLNGLSGFEADGYELHMTIKKLPNENENQALAREIKQDFDNASRRSVAVEQFKNFVVSRCDKKTQQAVNGLLGLGQLGVVEPTTTAAIVGAAATIMASIVALLDKIMPNGDAPNQTVDVPLDDVWTEADEAALQAEVDAAFAADIDGKAKEDTGNKDTGNKTLIDVAKENPLPTAGLLLGVAALGYVLISPKESSKKQQLNGTKKRRTRRTRSRRSSREKYGFSGLQ